MVNFNGIATIIDLLGGIEVNITEDEMNYINGYLTDTVLCSTVVQSKQCDIHIIIQNA